MTKKVDRSRKVDYGITDTSTLKALKKPMPKGAADSLVAAHGKIKAAIKGVKVKVFYGSGGTRRHIRRLARMGVISIVTKGVTYPKPYIS